MQFLGKTSTPNFSFDGSDNLKTKWHQIDKSSYHSIDEEEFQDPILSVLKDEALEQLSRDARSQKIRDDYLESNDISLKLLGVRTTRKIRVIGATGKARWMAKFLLIAKCYLLRDHLQLEDSIWSILHPIGFRNSN